MTFKKVLHAIAKLFVAWVSGVVVMTMLAGAAYAWPKCAGNWVEVPPGTKGPGKIYKDKQGTWECIVDKDGGGVKIKNTNTNNNTNTSSSSSSSSATSSSSSSAAGGDASNSNNTTNNVAAGPASTAYAPTALPTVPCFKSYGAGFQGSIGLSIGGGKVDENCVILEAARSLALHGSDLAYCKVMVSHKALRKAGVTLEDCMRVYEPPKPEPVQPSPAVAPQAPPQIIVPAPAVTVNVPAPVIAETVPAQAPAVSCPKPVKRVHHVHRDANDPCSQKK